MRNEQRVGRRRGRRRRGRRLRGVATALCALLLGIVAFDAAGLVVVNQPWLKPASRGQTVDVYLNLTSTEGATLVGVTTDEAAEVRLRAPGPEGRVLKTLALPAGKEIALAPGRTRLSLRKIARTIKLGDRIALILTIEDATGARQNIPAHAEARWHSPVEDERLARLPGHDHDHGHSH